MTHNSKSSSVSFKFSSIMKSFALVFSATILMTTVGSNCHLASAKEVEDKSYLSAVGPDRELGLYFRRCQTFLPCGSNQEAYRVCYYGMTAGAEPQTTCWRNTPAQNFLANALRLIRRLRCGGCDMASI